MVSKWEYLAEKLNDRGHHKLAKEALVIEGHLKDVYGNTTTKPFEQVVGLFGEEVYAGLTLLRIAEDATYCIGCEETEEDFYEGVGMCKLCGYGIQYGFCMDNDSEYMTFRIKLKCLLEGD